MNGAGTSRRRFIGLAGSAAAAGAAGQAPAKKIRYALVGLGRLIQNHVLPAFAQCSLSRVTALVSGDPEKARRLADQYGVSPKNIYNYQNYDQLSGNDEVDAVYIALPNGMHAEYTVRGAKAGKHVLVEKPMANKPEECQAMVEACRRAGRKLMVGYRLRHQPYHQRAIRICREKQFGAVKLILADAGFNMRLDPNEWRFRAKLAGGGSLMDLGVYVVQATRYFIAEEPLEINAHVYSDPADPRFREVEETVVFQLRFPSGALANCSSSYGHAGVNRCRVMGASDWFELDPAFGYSGQRLRIQRGGIQTSAQKGGQFEETEPDHKSQFPAEIDHFSECILANKEPVSPGEDGLQDVRIMMAIYRAAEAGKTIRV